MILWFQHHKYGKIFNIYGSHFSAIIPKVNKYVSHFLEKIFEKYEIFTYMGFDAFQ